MLTVKKTGDWGKIARLFRSREKRLDRMRHNLVRELMKRFKKDLESKLPASDEMKQYVEAIEERRLTGSFRKPEFAYALIAVPEKMDLKDLNKAQTVVYAVRTKSVVSDLAVLLIELSPWIVDRLPVNIPEDEVKLHHRNVTEDEVERLRERSDEVLATRKSDLRKAGARFKRREEDPDPPQSMPDLAFKALRMELGIKHRQVKHWGYAIEQVENHLKQMLRGDNDYRKYIADPYFTEWNAPMENREKMSAQEFLRDYFEFQKRVTR
jgi:hypothetical protein